MQFNSQNAVQAAMKRWVEDVVVGHQLCPFARDVLNRLRIKISHSTTIEGILQDAQDELERLVNTDPDVLPTSILAVPQGLDVFNDYLDVLDLLETGLAHAGLDGQIQIASFHPRYVFDGADLDDPANGTNRSPVPAFHFLREDDVEQARMRHPDTESVPDRNIRLFRKMGKKAVNDLLGGCWNPTD